MTNSNQGLANLTPHLPLDIIIDILSRLPVKPLLRFTSVCKAWYGLIKSHDFILKHLKSPSCNAFLVTKQNPFDDYIVSLVHEDSLDSATVVDFSDLGIMDGDDMCGVGVCNGLVCICLSFRDCQLILFNPATRQFDQIPHCRWWDKSKEIEFETVGFGFHPSNDDYKLIITVRYERLNGELVNHVEIYSLSSDNWKDIQMPFSLSLSYLVAVPGIFYWETYDLAYPDKTIVSFNMSDEVFQLIEGPRFLHQIWDETYHKFVELKEELALVVTSDERYFTVWVLNEDGNFWSKKFEVEPVIGKLTELTDVGHITVLGCSRNGDLVFEVNRVLDTELLLYDRKSREIKSLPFDKFCSNYEVFGFKETLHPVKKVNQV